jgi:NAD(P)-dependent dehydrogenase (short-subunit alcohol dehydrogenase family)
VYDTVAPVERETAWSVARMPNQTGRTVVITGANSGLGLASATVLAAHGARLVLVCRSPERGAAALEQVRRAATAAEPSLARIDLGDLAMVRAAGAELADDLRLVDVLVNNAGVMLQPRGWTADGLETHMASNHFGHFALTGALMPALSRSPAPRVVAVSSLAMWIGRISWDDMQWRRRRYSKWLAYGQSKLANFMFMLELGRRARRAGHALISAGAHPGGAHTNLVTHSPVGSFLEHKVLGPFFQEADDGALPQLYAATMPVQSGDYFAPRGPGGLEIGGPLAAGQPRRIELGDAARLWDVSEAITGVTYVWPDAVTSGQATTEKAPT